MRFMLSLLCAAAFVAQPMLLIRDVTVIDGLNPHPAKGQNVLVVDGKFSYIGAALPPRLPSDVRVVDGHGKFLIPGLWDMHVHWYDESRLRLFTANGVTGIRIMFGMPMHLSWRAKDQAGTLAGPHMYVGSPIVDGPKPIWPGSIKCATAQEGKDAVDKIKKDGYDFIKVYSLLPREAYFAIAKEAKAQGIDFEGHVPQLIRLPEAIEAGQKSSEHLYGIEVAISDKEDEAMKGRDEESFPKREAALVAGTQNPAKAAKLYSQMAKAKMWQCPTLTVLRALSRLDQKDFTDDPRLKYMPRSLVSMWDPKNDFRLKSRTKEDWEAARKRLPITMGFVLPMKKAGVRFLAGTDCLNPYVFPGFGLHDELALLVSAGLSPFEALQAATSGAAEFMGRKDVGAIQVGRIADFVLLDADPLKDIRNTRKILGVGQRGEYFDRKALDGMLSDLEARAR